MTIRALAAEALALDAPCVHLSRPLPLRALRRGRDGGHLRRVPEPPRLVRQQRGLPERRLARMAGRPHSA
eukprot:4957755-Alexandrium_andersonii.AAC.1